MKQSMLIEILNCDDKQRSKAMETVGGVIGVESVALRGENRNHLAVVANGVDTVYLIKILRKKIKRVELVSVTPINGNLIEVHQHPTIYRRPSYQAVVPYDPHGNKPNYYDNYGYRSNDSEWRTVM